MTRGYQVFQLFWKKLNSSGLNLLLLLQKASAHSARQTIEYLTTAGVDYESCAIKPRPTCYFYLVSKIKDKLVLRFMIPEDTVNAIEEQ